jgi:hypothetical protein
MYLLLAGLFDGPRHGYAIAQLAREIDRVAAEVARRTEERLASR